MKALVLAAGYGTRLGDATRAVPKPMLPLAGKPLLDYTLRYLARFGFDRVALNLHVHPEIIRRYCGAGDAFGVRIHYAYEKALLGTAGAVKNLEEYFKGEENFLVIYGDLLVDQDLSALVCAHEAAGATATLVVHRRHGSNSIVSMNGDCRITGFVERPSAWG